jgi:hypothetical protein
MATSRRRRGEVRHWQHPGDGRAGERSRELFAAAQAVIPGGVNSPVRAFKSVGGDPPFIRAARGAHLLTEDGATLIDYVGHLGPGDPRPRPPGGGRGGHPRGARRPQLRGLQRPRGRVRRAALHIVPALRGGMVRLVSSGTEATMSALRLARGFTGRSKIVKADGGYHGHADMLLVAAGSGAATLGIPGSAGVPEATVHDTLTVPYNDADAFERVLAGHRGQVAADHHRAGRRQHGLRAAAPGYLERLRALCSRARRAADLRRGDDGLSRRPRRRPGPLRRRAGPHLPRQDRRRRHALRRLRRSPGDHAADRPARAGLPGRHAQREPAGRRRRPRDPARSSSARTPTRRSRRPPPRSPTASPRWPRDTACRWSATASDRCSPASSAAARSTTTRREGQRPGRVRPLPPRDAGPRRVPGAVAVRGRLRVGGARPAVVEHTLGAADEALAIVARGA